MKSLFSFSNLTMYMFTLIVRLKSNTVIFSRSVVDDRLYTLHSIETVS